VATLPLRAKSAARSDVVSEPRRYVDREHRRSPGVDGFDDLGVVDAFADRSR
jgi:hypothetical protein